MTGDRAGPEAAGDFGGFEGRAWLNCAHQGPLPLAAADQVILGNSTSYGLQLLVQGVEWRQGDEVLLVDGDFPATIAPWLPLAERGVRVRLLRPQGAALDAGQLEAELKPSTRLFCTSWGFSFTGQAADLAALGRETPIRLRDDLGAAAWDVFGTANFLNFRSWTASVEYLLGLGVDRVAARDQALVERFLQGRTEALYERLTGAGVDVALRRGRLWVSPHLYNTEADIDRALEVLGGRMAPVESR